VRIFALSDLHLSFASNKPMDIFGPAWQNHAAKIETAWRECVTPEDTVLVGGDISWGMKLRDAQPDLDWLGQLPGTKVVVKGNHDYWWTSLKKLRDACDPSILFLQNEPIRIGDVCIGGTRLWDYPGIRWPFVTQPRDGQEAEVVLSHVPPKREETEEQRRKRQEDDEKIRARELQRLQQSLSLLDKDAACKIALVHYPPLSADGALGEPTAVMAEYGVDLCVYGHIHGVQGLDIPAADLPAADGMPRFVLSSADWLDFRPKLIR